MKKHPVSVILKAIVLTFLVLALLAGCSNAKAKATGSAAAAPPKAANSSSTTTAPLKPHSSPIPAATLSSAPRTRRRSR